MSHKITVILLTFLMLVSTIAILLDLSVGTVAADNSSDFQYTLINNGTAVEITGYTGPGGAVVIPSTISGEPVTDIGNNSFFNCYTLTSVTIPGTVQRIDGSAFFQCIFLTSASLSSNLTYIGDYAFMACTSLRSIAIPANVTGIGDGVFYDCSSFTSINVPDNLTSIGDQAFAYCTSLTSIDVGQNNTQYTSVNGVLYDKGRGRSDAMSWGLVRNVHHTKHGHDHRRLCFLRVWLYR